MSGFGEKSSKESVSSKTTLRFRQPVLAALAIVVVAALAIFLYFNHVRNQALQQELAGLRQQMEQIGAKAEAARARATEAEQNAWQSATLRDQAENSRDAAQAEAKRAAERAEEARQRADSAEKEKQAAIEEAERTRKEREEEMGRLQEALQKIAETRRTAMGLVMNLDSHAIQFEFDKAELRSENRELLSRIAGILLTSKGYSISIYGHTDDVGSEAYNQELSERRAQAVRDYLVQAGIGPEIMATRGFGKSKPLVAGKTPEARAKNRRVEVEIVDTILNYNLPK